MLPRNSRRTTRLLLQVRQRSVLDLLRIFVSLYSFELGILAFVACAALTMDVVTVELSSSLRQQVVGYQVRSLSLATQYDRILHKTDALPKSVITRALDSFKTSQRYEAEF